MPKEIDSATAACATATTGDDIEIVTDSFKDAFEVVCEWTEGEARVLGLDRDGLHNDGYDITLHHQRLTANRDETLDQPILDVDRHGCGGDSYTVVEARRITCPADSVGIDY